MNSTIPFCAYKGTEPYLFVSYAHKDREIVFPLILALHEQRRLRIMLPYAFRLLRLTK